MRRMALIQTVAVLIAGLFLGSAPAMATPANFDSYFGFEEAGLGGLNTVDMGLLEPFLGARDVLAGSADVEFTGSTDLCILFGDETCRASALGITGPYSVLVTYNISAVNTPEIDGPFTLFLTGLLGGGYSTSEVAIELNPVVPTSLNTAAVPGFVWNGGFTPLVHVIDNGAPPDTFHYVGWEVMLGDSLTFRYDVLVSPNGRGTPQLTAAATPKVVPEPGTALLIGLGLAGLASAGPRTNKQEVL